VPYGKLTAFAHSPTSEKEKRLCDQTWVRCTCSFLFQHHFRAEVDFTVADYGQREREREIRASCISVVASE